MFISHIIFIFLLFKTFVFIVHLSLIVLVLSLFIFRGTLIINGIIYLFIIYLKYISELRFLILFFFFSAKRVHHPEVAIEVSEIFNIWF